LWGFVYPRPYVPMVAILAAMPWIAVEIVRRSGGLFRIDSYRNDAHPTVAIAFIAPGMVLAARSLLDFNTVYSWAVLWFAIGIGVPLCLAARAVDPSVRAKPATLVAMFLFSIAYGFGAAMQANTLLDRSTGTIYTASVEGKRVLSGRVTTWELELGAWGPRTKANRVRVTRATYNATNRGDTVYLALKRGALGVNWYVMRH
jgi:hypothetical protein